MDQNIVLRLSLQRALIGVLTDSVVGVTAQIHDRVITIVVYFNCAVSDDEQELTSEIAGEVIADFPDATIVERSISAVQNQLVTLEFWAILKAGFSPT